MCLRYSLSLPSRTRLSSTPVVRSMYHQEIIVSAYIKPICTSKCPSKGHNLFRSIIPRTFRTRELRATEAGCYLYNIVKITFIRQDV